LKEGIKFPENVKTLSDLENSISSPKNYSNFSQHLKTFFQAYPILRMYYNQKKNFVQKFKNYSKKQKLYQGFVNKHFPIQDKDKTLVAWGSSHINSPIIKLGHTIGSSKPLLKLIKERATVIMTPEHYSSQVCCKCNEKELKAEKKLNPKLTKLIHKNLREKNQLPKEIGNDQHSPKLKEYLNSEIQKDFEKKYPKSKENIKTRLLACSKCHQRVCRDVNASFKIIHNFLSYLDKSYQDLSSTRFLKQKAPKKDAKICKNRPLEPTEILDQSEF